MSQPPTPPGPPTQPLPQPQPQSWPQQGMQPPADRGVDPDGPATDAASTPTDGSASIAGWTPPPWTAGPDAFWRIPAGLLIAIALVLVSAVAGWYLYASRSATGQPEAAPAEPTQVRTGVATGESDLSGLPHDYKLRVIDLRVGDCFDLKDESADEIEDVTAVPCTTEHQYEVFYVGAMDEGSYPTDDEFGSYVTKNCNPAFDAYIGKAYDDSDVYIYWQVPTDATWWSGDRTVLCAAYYPRIHRLTGSLRGAQQ